MDASKRFDQTKAEHMKRIQQLRGKLEAGEEELTTLQTERAKILRIVSDPSELSAIDDKIEVTRKRISQLLEMIESAETVMREELITLIPQVDTHRAELAKSAELAYENEILEANRIKLEYLRAAVKIGMLVRSVDEAHASGNQRRREVGLDEIKHWGFVDRTSTEAHPSFTGFDRAAEDVLGVPNWLVRAALAGKLPAFRGDSDNE